jgi:hypothetical protein
VLLVEHPCKGLGYGDVRQCREPQHKASNRHR